MHRYMCPGLCVFHHVSQEQRISEAFGECGGVFKWMCHLWFPSWCCQKHERSFSSSSGKSHTHKIHSHTHTSTHQTLFTVRYKCWWESQWYKYSRKRQSPRNLVSSCQMRLYFPIFKCFWHMFLLLNSTQEEWHYDILL